MARRLVRPGEVSGAPRAGVCPLEPMGAWRPEALACLIYSGSLAVCGLESRKD